jgi:hypothetical protein
VAIADGGGLRAPKADVVVQYQHGADFGTDPAPEDEDDGMQTLLAQGWKLLLGLLVAVLLLVAFSGPPTTEPPPPVAQPAVQPRETLRKTTQVVLDIAEARRQGGVPAADVREPAPGLEVYAQAYRESVGQVGTIAVERKLKLHEAEHGRAPETYEEFMQSIIGPGTPDGIQLPMLPYYQEYAYDPATRKLLVMEFPAKKEQRRRETTGAAGL